MSKILLNAVIACFCFGFISCSEDKGNTVGDLLPTDATHLLYISRGSTNPIESLNTIKANTHDNDFFFGKYLINKDQYEMNIILDGKTILDSRNNRYFDLILETDTETGIKGILVPCIFFPNKGISEYNLIYKIKCPKIFEDSDFHEIAIKGDYVLKNNKQHVFISKEANYMNTQALELKNTLIDKYKYKREISISLPTLK